MDTLKAVPSSPGGLSFHVLGRLEAYDDGVELDVGPRKQRAVLALLLLSANHVVSTERLIDDLWGDSPPSTARATLQVYVAGLRKALGSGGASLLTRAPGYVLEVEPGILDLDRFTQLRAQARASPDLEHRAALLHDALRLWRDEPLPELRTEPFAAAAVAQLEQLRLAALEERIDADVALGRQAELVTELESLVAEHPYRERLRAQLMLALYRSGRQADALDAYQAGRRALQDDLGLEPGNELRDLEAAILRQDEALSPPPPVSAAEPDQPPPSRRLSRRAVIVAGAGGLAAVALGGGVTAFRSRGPGGTQIHPGSVGVVDPATRRVAEIPVGFGSPLIATGEGAVWLVDEQGTTLTGIDPETNDVFLDRKSISVEGIPTGLAAGEGAVWIGLIQGRVLSVLEVGPEFGNVRGEPIVLERTEKPLNQFTTAATLTVGAGAVWVLERGFDTVSRIDPTTKIAELFAEGAGAARSIAVDGDAVWLGGNDGVKKLDLDTGVPLGDELVEPAIESTTISIAVGADAVWFVGDSSTDLWRIDPSSVSLQPSVPIGASPSAVAVGEDEAVWVAGRSVTSLWRLDPKTTKTETIGVGANSGGLVADFGQIWTSPEAFAG